MLLRLSLVLTVAACTAPPDRTQSISSPNAAFDQLAQICDNAAPEEWQVKAEAAGWAPVSSDMYQAAAKNIAASELMGTFVGSKGQVPPPGYYQARVEFQVNELKTLARHKVPIHYSWNSDPDVLATIVPPTLRRRPQATVMCGAAMYNAIGEAQTVQPDALSENAQRLLGDQPFKVNSKTSFGERHQGEQTSTTAIVVEDAGEMRALLGFDFGWFSRHRTFANPNLK